MRLIDADKLIDYFYYGIDDKPIIDGISDRKIIDIIKNQPSVYSVDKVVEELQEIQAELEDYKHIKQWKSDIMDAFCRYDCNSVEEAIHNGYITGYKEAFEETLATIKYYAEKYYADTWDGIYQAIDELEEKWKEWEDKNTYE